MLELIAISIAFEEQVLSNISLTINQNEIIGLVGKSGVGKSSFLKIIAGLIDQDSGEVILNGQVQSKSSNKLLPGFDDIKLVNQDFKLDLYHTVEENIREAILFFPNDKRQKRIDQLLRLVELKPLRNQKAHLLSGGEQQRLAIVRAIAKKPLVLLLDEPFAHLDARLRLKLTNHLLRIRDKEGLAIVLVSHDGQELLGIADVICLLKNGRLSKKRNSFDTYYQITNKSDALLFGPVNSILLKQKTILFRPDEYTIVNNGLVKLHYTHSVFFGAIYYNYFRSSINEEIILFSFEPIIKNLSIDIVKKHKKRTLDL